MRKEDDKRHTKAAKTILFCGGQVTSLMPKLFNRWLTIVIHYNPYSPLQIPPQSFTSKTIHNNQSKSLASISKQQTLKLLKIMKSISVAVIVAVAMVAFMVEPGRAIECGQVKAFLLPCVSYLANGGNPTQECCTGVSSLQKNTPTVAQRQDACQCIKDAASLLPKIDEAAASNLPAACKVQINIPISKDTDCKAVK